MSLQTDAPLERLRSTKSPRTGSWFAQLREEGEGLADPLLGGLDLSPVYQRGSVWTADQRRLLFRSILTGTPVPAVIVNDRREAGYRTPDGLEDWRYAVVDGKQRVESILAWHDDALTLPASWFEPGHIDHTVPGPDGPHVVRSSLSSAGRRDLDRTTTLPVCEAHLPTLAAEADLYLLVNRGGVAHDESDLTTARALAVGQP